MRILLVTDQYPPMVGGVPATTHKLAVDLVRRGHHVCVIAPGYCVRDAYRVEDGVHVYRFASFEWPTYKDQRIVFTPFRRFYKIIKEMNPDVVHVHSPVVLGNIAQLLAHPLGLPVIATNHFLPINMSRSLATHPLFGKPFSKIVYSYLVFFYNFCDYVTAPTRTALNLLYDHGLRIPATPISNGIDMQKFGPGQRDPQLLQRLGLPADRPIALHVNRLFHEKKVDVLVDAIAKLKTNAHVAIVGTGPAEAELREQAARLNLGDKVSFLGFVSDEDLLPLRRSADLFVIPSEADLQSISTLEAMACGLPVIAANSYALAELVDHGTNGFLFAPGNSTELAQHMDTLLSNPSLCVEMGQRSLQKVQVHDRERVLETWENLYRRLSIEFQEAKADRQQMRLARQEFWLSLFRGKSALERKMQEQEK
ncbi:glycosyltransferase involved in cell wall biosynthesis [Thermosporothrix hazakensis]|jgi:glycosyltransferase involved in cell wall biosynthesis|uniref:Glycosyltransferase involved in cell wall biosynthesis n=2 Tax=Thermosporothrix TaxID=768650 RepID=A0A326UCV8_THEHA|nr:glycosyltransferase [Thermosporothrix hazakensis]PZW34459.1 glycosyltransferase involved in cell wall biosynthesis [Thermosporothrix hazakensis]BBH85582.1 glycosyl transferase [Thermosporothrix sp. COM3]GCE45991.1 glycosyl transferase [Thermosporothrix hazakensis]